MVMPREQFGISLTTNNQTLQSNLDRHPRGVLKYRLDKIEDEELVHTSNGTKKSFTKMTKGEPHNLDFTIGNGIIFPLHMNNSKLISKNKI